MTQLQQIKEQKEKEAAERLREIERQREEQRLLNLKHEAKLRAAAEEKSGLDKLSADVDSGIGKISAGMGKLTAEMDKLLSVDKLRDKITFKKDEEAVGISGWVGEGDGGQGGWMCAPEMVVRTTEEEDDPFMVQREQLLSYIAQAREAKRMDEVRALEQSLIDIEQFMEQQQMSYGMDHSH